MLTMLKHLAATAALVGMVVCTGLARAAEPLQVGLIVSGSTADGGWNQLARASLDKLQKEGKLKYAVVEKVDPSRAADQMRDFAARGFALTIGHGYEFFTPAAEVAPDVAMKLAVSGSDKSDPHVLTMDFDLAQACYQCGILAAMESKSGKIAFIGGSEIPALIACYNGFEAGARSVKPAIQVVKAYTSWDRPELSKSQAEAFINQGIDVILQNVDAASRGVFEAVREANKRGTAVWVFGTNSDQNANPICADHTLASAVIRLDEAFGRAVDSVASGTFKGGVQPENMVNGVCVTVVNPALTASGVITPEMTKAIDEAAAKIKAGEVTIQHGK